MKPTRALQPSRVIQSNLNQGSYTPAFFQYDDFAIKSVESVSIEADDITAEQSLIHNDASFYYLREEELRTLTLTTENGRIPFDDFLSHLGMHIDSRNLYKTGKYISRVFRPSRYAGHYRDLDIHMNYNHSGKTVDGISLLHVDIAREVGWKKAEAGDSAQFTLFYADGLVKGHCVLSDTIEHDTVVYGEDNIKTELTLGNGLQYVALEPVKLSSPLRLDIQTLLNLWEAFGAETYLSWADEGLETFKQALLDGCVEEYLQTDELDPEKYDSEGWLLQKAIYHKLDYRQFPGLFRSAWMMFRKSLLKLAVDTTGLPKFRIPVPDAYRGYLRIDLRNHNSDGTFTPTVEPGETALDTKGNLWIHPDDADNMLDILGGADFDDGVGVIPVEGGKALIYRNPNQYGEYWVSDITYEGISIEKEQQILSLPKQKQSTIETIEKSASTGNPLLDNLLAKKNAGNKSIVPYTRANVLKTMTKILQNSTSIGQAANAEMLKTGVLITRPQQKKNLDAFNWNLERIIDSQVKDGVDAKEDMQAVKDLMQYLIEKKIPVPKSLVRRFPSKQQPEAKIAKDHPLDQLLEAIEYLINKADEDMLGKGSASQGNRIPGYIDTLEIPVLEIGERASGHGLEDAARALLKNYNRDMAILLSSTADMPLQKRETMRKAGIDGIQEKLLEKLTEYTADERTILASVWAFTIYKSERSVHDSILWIGDKESLHGTSDDTIQMLADIGIAHQVEKRPFHYDRVLKRIDRKIEVSSLRLWSKEELPAEEYQEAAELIVADGKALLGEQELNLGDECSVSDGIYAVREIVNTASRKNPAVKLSKSITVYLQ